MKSLLPKTSELLLKYGINLSFAGREVKEKSGLVLCFGFTEGYINHFDILNFTSKLSGEYIISPHIISNRERDIYIDEDKFIILNFKNLIENKDVDRIMSEYSFKQTITISSCFLNEIEKTKFENYIFVLEKKYPEINFIECLDNLAPF